MTPRRCLFCLAQTACTGALPVMTTDPSGAVVPGTNITMTAPRLP